MTGERGHTDTTCTDRPGLMLTLEERATLAALLTTALLDFLAPAEPEAEA